MNNTTAIRIRNCNVAFDGKKYLINFSLDIPSGEFCALTGPSGSGKSTIINALLGFSLPDTGCRIEVNNLPLNEKTVKQIRASIGWLPQQPIADATPVETFLMRPFLFAQNKNIKPSHTIIEERMLQLGLTTDLLQKKMEQLSGGQRQRIGLIQLLLLNRSILLLDEPTSALDNESKELLWRVLKKIPDLTILSVSHDEWWLERMNHVINTSDYGC